MTKVIIPGTFDPITCGHLDVIERASKLFDEIVVGVAASKSKGAGPLFSLDERAELVSQATGHLSNVEVLPFTGLLVEFAASVGATAVVKGLRAATDFEYEFQMAALNFRLDPELETLFVTSSPDLTFVSSSVIKEVASLGGDVSGMVPPCVLPALKAKMQLTD